MPRLPYGADTPDSESSPVWGTPVPVPRFTLAELLADYDPPARGLTLDDDGTVWVTKPQPRLPDPSYVVDENRAAFWRGILVAMPVAFVLWVLIIGSVALLLGWRP